MIGPRTAYCSSPSACNSLTRLVVRFAKSQECATFRRRICPINQRRVQIGVARARVTAGVAFILVPLILAGKSPAYRSFPALSSTVTSTFHVVIVCLDRKRHASNYFGTEVGRVSGPPACTVFRVEKLLYLNGGLFTPRRTSA